ncbi:MAG: HpcH/HpaI aldolase family protein [Methyloligellaceae bacterium]
MTLDPIRDKLGRGERVFAAWTMLGSSYVVELAGEAAWDAVIVDQQHGLGGAGELLACLTAAAAVPIPALVRVSANDGGAIGRALDAGAQGVIVPMINTPEDARRLASAVKYPPLGARSWGPYRGRLVHKGDYVKDANGWTIACAQIETRAAVEAIDDILKTEGIDMVCIGPNDLCLSLTDGSARDVRHPAVAEALDVILSKCRQHQVIAGIYANDSDFANTLIDKGWDVISIGNDMGYVGVAFTEILSNAKRMGC